MKIYAVLLHFARCRNLRITVGGYSEHDGRRREDEEVGAYTIGYSCFFYLDFQLNIVHVYS